MRAAIKEQVLDRFAVRIAIAARAPQVSTQARYERLSIATEIFNEFQLIPEEFGADFPKYRDRYEGLLRRLLIEGFGASEEEAAGIGRT